MAQSRTNDSLTTLLAPLAALYRAATSARNAYFRLNRSAARQAAIAVVSVGNLTVGGSGKTPLVAEIARRLIALGRRPAILTRGYAAPPGQEADEVLEYRETLPDVPVVVNPDRVAGASEARERHSVDCVILDDGFQHRRLARDLDIVVIDALDPWGGGWVLPAGRLREPRSGLRRASLAILSRRNQINASQLASIESEIRRIAPQVPILRAITEVTALIDDRDKPVALDSIAGHSILPVCGLGNPATFELALRSVATRVAPAMRFPDHHSYSPRDWDRIQRAAATGGAELIVTTGKDWVKLRRLASAADKAAARFACLRVRATIADPDGELTRRLERLR